jgi:hypothetical protein
MVLERTNKFFSHLLNISQIYSGIRVKLEQFKEKLLLNVCLEEFCYSSHISHTIIVLEGPARNMCKSLSIRLDVSNQIPKQISVVETKSREYSLQHYLINNFNAHL